MNRTDRVLAILTRDLSLNEVLAMGATPTDACDVVSLLNLELELGRRAKVRRVIEDAREFLDGLQQ